MNSKCNLEFLRIFTHIEMSPRSIRYTVRHISGPMLSTFSYSHVAVKVLYHDNTYHDMVPWVFKTSFEDLLSLSMPGAGQRNKQYLSKDSGMLQCGLLYIVTYLFKQILLVSKSYRLSVSNGSTSSCRAIDSIHNLAHSCHIFFI